MKKPAKKLKDLGNGMAIFKRPDGTVFIDADKKPTQVDVDEVFVNHE